MKGIDSESRWRVLKKACVRSFLPQPTRSSLTPQPPVNRLAKRVNVRLLIGVLAVGVATAVSIRIVHRVQVARNAGGLAKLARAKLDDGKNAEAMGLFARYLAYRPNDAAAQAELARLVIEMAERPNATKEQRGYAYNVVEAAVRKNPDNRPLRKQLAEWMLRYRRFGDASTELAILRQQTAAAPPGDSDADSVDPDSIELLQSRALAGNGEYPKAAATAAAILGFSLDTKSFDPLPSRQASADVVLDASLVLATILNDKLKDPAAAAAVLKHLVVTNPKDAQAWLALARWHQSGGQLADSAAAIRKASELAPDAPDVLFADLELSIAEQRYTAAETLATKARQLFPSDERGFRGIAAIAMRQQDTDRAVASLREGLVETPGQPSLLLMLADVLLQANRLEEAGQTINTFVERQGATSPAVGILEARLLIAQKRWMQAKQKLDSVRPLVAESEQLTRQVDLSLGQCYEMLGQFDEQLAANQRVLSEDQGSLAARVGVANALAASGKPDAALKELEEVAASFTGDQLPKVPQVWNPLLQLRIAAQMKRPPTERDWTSVDQLIAALEQSPTIADAQLALLRADLLVRKGDSQAAAAVLQKQVESDPSNTQLLAALALLTLRTQGPAAAGAWLDKAPAAIADDPLLLLVRAQMASRASAEEATAALEKLKEKAGSLPAEQSVRLLSAIASIYRGLGESAEAERSWQAALEKRPDDLGVRAALFEMACEEGNVEKAQAAAAEISRLAGPTSPQGRVAAAAALLLNVRVQQAKKTAAAGPRQGGSEGPTLSDADDAQLVSAKNLLIEAENDRPGWAQIQQLFAEIAGLQGDMPTAIERLQQAMRLGPANPSVIRQLVSLLYLSNRLEEAQQALDLVGPDGLGGMERLSAELDMRSGQFDNAVAIAERSLAAKQQHSASDLLWFGQLLARAGKTDRAGEVLQQAVEADPSQPSVWLALFSSQLAAGQNRSAEQTLAKGGESLAPPQSQMFLAQGYELLGRIDDAEQSFREAVAAAPDSSAATRSLAGFLVRRGRLKAACEALEAIIAATGSDPARMQTQRWARRTLAEITAQSGSYRDAERAVALITENTDDKGRLTAEDLALQEAILAARPEPDCWRRALGILDTIASLQPLSTAQRTQKAQLLEKLGRWNESRDELLSIASAPNTPPAFQALLIESLLRHQELPAARIWLNTLADRLPDAPAVSILQAKLALAEKDRAAAVAAIRKLIPDDTPKPELFRPLSALLEELGFSAAADKVFSQFAAASTDGVIAQAGYLGRAQRTDEALDLLDASWETIPLENLLRTAVSVLGSQSGSATSQQTERIGSWFEKARRLDPASPSLAMLYADFTGLTGNHDDTVAIYRKLLARTDLSPRQAAVAANNLAFHLAEPTTAAEAEKLIAVAIAELGPHPDVLDTRGIVLLAAGKGRESLADLKEAVLMPSATKYLHLASALASEQQIDAARQAFAEAKKIGFTATHLSSGDRRRLKALETALGQ